MADVNKVILIGRMGRDPEMRYTQSGKEVTNFSLAVDGRGENGDTTWFQVTCWQKLAEIVNQYGAKGRLVYVEGRVELDTYQTNGGDTRASLKVTAYSVQFLDKKRTNGGNAQADTGVDDLDF